jgi:hypothetical protein
VSHLRLTWSAWLISHSLIPSLEYLSCMLAFTALRDPTKVMNVLEPTKSAIAYQAANVSLAVRARLQDLGIFPRLVDS